MPLIETLYKTNVPGELPQAEYYQPRLEPRAGYDRKPCFVVTEKHGWYDASQTDTKFARKIQVTTLNPQSSEGFATIEEAFRRYDQQVQRRVGDGFVHSFSIEFDGETMGPVTIYKDLTPKP
jgi:hypothetical protein